MKRIKRQFLLLLLLISALALCAAGCGSQEEPDIEGGKIYDIYYVNNEETKIFSNSYQTATEDKQALLDELLGQLAVIPDKGEYKAPLAGNFALLGYIWDGGQLTVNFDEHYKEMDNIREILVRAAIVRTLSQVEGVNYISFTVLNEPLADSSGVAIGTMSSDTFIDNAGNEINTYEKVNLRLYFANENGDRLVEENQRNVVYNSNMSLEKLVVEKLIEGPAAAGDYPTINPATKIISVTVNDRICYVNLDESFLSQPYNVTNDVTIYSIANSLVELPNVNKVQISVNGETNVLYKESVSLTNIFERNLDLLESAASAAE
ncbi:MAG: GerMN domain-containing protein [Roseburia sp.]|nr:GerMN domain-containing protein [Ruminococcus sp.]MCM1156025.1 GerMN domain-containing protein [Roseburia sp.]MCM1242871.1 GerMN domain-containing protein [Roseburia sp.]